MVDFNREKDFFKDKLEDWKEFFVWYCDEIVILESEIFFLKVIIDIFIVDMESKNR